MSQREGIHHRAVISKKGYTDIEEEALSRRKLQNHLEKGKAAAEKIKAGGYDKCIRSMSVYYYLIMISL